MKDFLLINKPEGWTSFDAVGYIRNRIKRTDPKHKNIKVGHAGTLDPFATGLLIIGVGRDATKRLDEFKKLPKTYLATLHLGATSNTDDKTGEIKPTSDSQPDLEEVKATLKQFLGKQLQIPPMFSAKKIDGQRLYKLARKGEEIKREPSEIEIYGLELIEYSYPLLKIKVSCSTGTYIRTLARDIGEKLRVGAYCEELTRTSIGEYDLNSALDPADPELLNNP
jgi:tRNA pseudouridine55 synthase